MTNEKTHYRDGAVVLYKRGRSSKWQARLKIGSGQKGWKRIATGESDVEKASEIACHQYDEVKFRIKYNYSPESKRFSHCAEFAKKEMELAVKTGKWKSIFSHYIGAINNYLVPFFGNKFIDSIDYNSLVDFNQFRIEKLNRNPARSTINTHNAALMRIFTVALKNNWIKPSFIPKLTNDGNTPPARQVRPYFEDEEYAKLKLFMKEWKKNGRKEVTRQIRTLLYDYVIVLACTGMRPGTEADFLKWNNISIFTEPKNGKEHVKFIVTGKTGTRELIGDEEVKFALNRIISRHPVFEFLDQSKPFEADAYVFSLPCTGRIPNDFGRAFKKCLQDSNLLYSSDEKERTLYSLRHTYATRKLIHNEVSVYELAIQMGTSVAMIEKHYGHVKASQLASKFNAGKSDGNLKVGMDARQTVNFLKNIKRKGV